MEDTNSESTTKNCKKLCFCRVGGGLQNKDGRMVQFYGFFYFSFKKGGLVNV